MNKSKRKNSNETSVVLTKALVDEMVRISFAHSSSSAIELAVRAVLSENKFPKYTLWDVNVLQPDSTGDNWESSYQKRKKKVTTKLYLPVALLDELLTVCKTHIPHLKSLSSRIEYCLICFLVEYQQAPLSRPIRLPGSKWGTMQKSISSILANRSYDTVVETCAGALGIFCTTDCAKKVILNDYDTGKFCFYEELANKPVRLLNNFLSSQPEVDKCKTYKKILKEIDVFYFRKAQSERKYSKECIADMFLYQNYYYKERRERGHVPLYEKPSSAYICTLLKVAERLKEIIVENLESSTPSHKVKLINEDMLTLIPKKDDNSTLIICDPPYPFTGAYNDNLTPEQHLKLAKMLNKCKGDFIYFCRLTERKADRIYPSSRLRGFITDMFASPKNFFMDVPTRDGLERIITNFPFDGGIPYSVAADVAKQISTTSENGGDSNE